MVMHVGFDRMDKLSVNDHQAHNTVDPAIITCHSSYDFQRQVELECQSRDPMVLRPGIKLRWKTTND